jgi:hypothetical protein
MKPVIKISTVHLYKESFIKRVKKTRLMELSILITLLMLEDWKNLYINLLTNIEQYTEYGILDYDYYPLENIVIRRDYFGIETIVNKLLTEINQ